VVAELVKRTGLIAALDEAVPGFKARRRGASAGEFLTAVACAQLAGADHLVGLDHRRGDQVTESFWPCPTPASSTVTALARLALRAGGATGARRGGGQRGHRPEDDGAGEGGDGHSATARHAAHVRLP
jgi:hypothetical protein